MFSMYAYASLSYIFDRYKPHLCSILHARYSYKKGDPMSERLRAWYEDKCGYVGPRWKGSGFRMCRKRLKAESFVELQLSDSASHNLHPFRLFIRWLQAVLLWLFCGLS